MQSAPLQKSPSLAVVDKPQFKLYGRPLAEILVDLAKPLPNRFLQARRQGGKELTYLSWHNANRLMDYFTGGGWEGNVVNVHSTATEVYVVYRVTIHAEEGRGLSAARQRGRNSWITTLGEKRSPKLNRNHFVGLVPDGVLHFISMTNQRWRNKNANRLHSSCDAPS